MAFEIITGAGPYAEAAHIRPLGRRHDGPDVAENILCLCPNDHVRFDYGVLFISDALEVQMASSGEVVDHRDLWGEIGA